MDNLIFLKLGGSLITDKTRPFTPRLDKLEDLAAQLATFRRADPGLLIVLGHGSGSFGHIPAKKYGTRAGISPPLTPPLGGRTGCTPEDRKNSPFPLRGKARMGAEQYWRGFAEVWYQASTLTRFVVSALHAAKIPAMALPPSASVTTKDGKVAAWDLSPLRRALEAGIMPVVHGDVIFDEARGGTILSTEDLFAHLAREMRPQRILLAGLEDGIYADFPSRKHRVTRVSPASYKEIRASIGTSHGTDVTGGMESKARQMLKLVESIPGLTVQIFSGEKSGHLEAALRGEPLGTLIESD